MWIPTSWASDPGSLTLFFSTWINYIFTAVCTPHFHHACHAPSCIDAFSPGTFVYNGCTCANVRSPPTPLFIHYNIVHDQAYWLNMMYLACNCHKGPAVMTHKLFDSLLGTVGQNPPPRCDASKGSLSSIVERSIRPPVLLDLGGRDVIWTASQEQQQREHVKSDTPVLHEPWVMYNY